MLNLSISSVCLHRLLRILRYSSGDVIIFMAGRLFHCVTKLELALMELGKDCTPERIKDAFFFSKNSYQVLKDKPTGWLASINGGFLKLESLAEKEAQEGGEGL